MNTSAIKAALYGWLSSAMGTPTIIVLNFSADLVTGNKVDAKINAVDARQTTFIDDHDTTMALLADNLHRHVSVFKAVVTGARQITVYGLIGKSLTFTTGPTVTGGATQATCTKSTSQNATPVTVIFADQAAPQPADPYASLRLTSLVPVGMDEIREIDPDTNIATIGGQRRLSVSVNLFGTGAVDLMSQALTSLGKVTVQEALYAAGLSVLRVGTMQNLTAVLETEFEDRVQADVSFGIAENIEDDLGIIETVEFEGDVSNGSITHVGPITVTK